MIFNKKIESIDDAKKFMQDLLLHGLLFHLDDDPAEVVFRNPAGQTQRTFTNMQAFFLRNRQDEIFSFSPQEWGNFECPHGYCVYLTTGLLS